MSDNCLVYVTADGADEARRIGEALVEERLAACVNIVGGMTSLYRWEGEVREGSETILIAKTRRSLVGTLTRRIVELHSYDCSCVVSLPIEGGNPAFLRWIETETA